MPLHFGLKRIIVSIVLLQFEQASYIDRFVREGSKRDQARAKVLSEL